MRKTTETLLTNKYSIVGLKLIICLAAYGSEYRLLLFIVLLFWTTYFLNPGRSRRNSPICFSCGVQLITQLLSQHPLSIVVRALRLAAIPYPATLEWYAFLRANDVALTQVSSALLFRLEPSSALAFQQTPQLERRVPTGQTPLFLPPGLENKLQNLSSDSQDKIAPSLFQSAGSFIQNGSVHCNHNLQSVDFLGLRIRL